MKVPLMLISFFAVNAWPLVSRFRSCIFIVVHDCKSQKGKRTSVNIKDCKRHACV